MGEIAGATFITGFQDAETSNLGIIMLYLLIAIKWWKEISNFLFDISIHRISFLDFLWYWNLKPSSPLRNFANINCWSQANHIFYLKFCGLCTSRFNLRVLICKQAHCHFISDCWVGQESQLLKPANWHSATNIQNSDKTKKVQAINRHYTGEYET